MANHTPLRLLIIDDSPEDTELLTEALDRATGSVLVASAGSAEEGLERARAGDFDLLLLDLPPPDAVRVLTSLRAVAQSRLMPVVVVTGRLLEDDVRAAYAAQVSAVLTKGQSFAELQALTAGLMRFWQGQTTPAGCQSTAWS